jgi:hypothetical protein
MVDGLPWDRHFEAGQQLLLQSLQLAAVPSAAAAAGIAPNNQQQQGLRLQSFSSYWRGTPALLSALPAHSLTQLHLDLGWPPAAGQGGYYDLDELAAAPALARLSSLQELRLSNTGYRCSYPASCAAGIAQLSQLTLLDLAQCDDSQWVFNAVDDNGDPDEQQPAQMPELRALLPSLPQLRVLHLPRCFECGFPWPALSFTHMTQLEVLTNYLPDDVDQHHLHEDGVDFTKVQFPAQLKQLGFGALTTAEQLDAVAELQQLQGLTFTYSLGAGTATLEAEPEAVPEAVQQLQPLAQLSALRCLSLSHGSATISAISWAHLTQLCEVEVRDVSKQQWEAISGGLAAATSLTKLELLAEAQRYVYKEVLQEPVAACGALAGLTRLRDLCIRPEAGLLPGDARALSALTSLTRLVLKDAKDGVDDEAAAAIGRSCRMLRHLDLRSCSLRSVACLSELAQLTQLTQLRLDGCNV